MTATHRENTSETEAMLDFELDRFMRLIQGDGGMHEIRALGVVRAQYPHKVEHIESGYYRPSDLDLVVKTARLTGAAGVYYLGSGNFKDAVQRWNADHPTTLRQLGIAVVDRATLADELAAASACATKKTGEVSP